MLKTVCFLAAIASVTLPARAFSQPAPVKGEAILKHPIGVLATKVVDLVAAGKIDDVMALRTKSDQAEWKTTSAAEKKDFGDRMKERAPSPQVFADLVRKAGELTIDGDSAMLMATTPAGTLRQTFEREGGQWRASFGPMFMPAAGAAATAPKETRVEGAGLVNHPAVNVVLQFADMVHAGKLEEALGKFGSAQAQAKWKALPASEKKESADFRKRILPVRAEITKALQAGGVLLIEGANATLNIIKIQPATATNSKGTSTTVAIPLTLESGQWKIAQ